MIVACLFLHRNFVLSLFDVYCIPIAFHTWQYEIFDDGEGEKAAMVWRHNVHVEITEHVRLAVEINDRRSIMGVDDGGDDGDDNGGDGNDVEYSV